MTTKAFPKPQKPYFIHKAIATLLSLCMICSSFTCQNSSILQERIDTLEEKVNQQGSNTNTPTSQSDLAEILLKFTNLGNRVTKIGDDIKDIKTGLKAGKIPSQEEWEKLQTQVQTLRDDHDELGKKVPYNLTALLTYYDKRIKDLEAFKTAQDAINQEYKTFKADVDKRLKEVNTNLQTEVNAAKAEAKSNLDTAIAALRTNLEAQIQASKGISQAELDALKLQMEQKLQEDLDKEKEELTSNFKGELKTAEKKAEDELKAAQKLLKDQIDQLTQAHQQHVGDVTTAKTGLNNAIKKAQEESKENLETAQTELEQKIEEAKQELINKLTKELGKLNTLPPAAAPDNGLQKTVTDLQAQMDALKEALKQTNGKVTACDGRIDGLAQKLQNEIEPKVTQALAECAASKKRLHSVDHDLISIKERLRSLSNRLTLTEQRVNPVKGFEK